MVNLGWIYDLPSLLRLHDVVAASDPDGAPSVQMVWPPGENLRLGRVGLLAGSFNPFHSAHEALVRAATSAAELDRLALVLSKRTVDKERITGLGLEDRLLTLRRVAAELPRCAVALVNRGLYVDQAELFRSFAGGRAEVWIVVGFDKIVQIFDPAYYEDREAALDRLFSLARVLVAPRGDDDLADLQRLLDRPENRRFRDAVRPLPISPDYAAVSSTRLRTESRSGGPTARALPPTIRRFLLETRAYSEPLVLPTGERVDAYAARVALLEALARARPWADEHGDLRKLVGLALSPSPAGAALRAWLRDPPPGSTAADLAAFQAAP